MKSTAYSECVDKQVHDLSGQRKELQSLGRDLQTCVQPDRQALLQLLQSSTVVRHQCLVREVRARHAAIVFRLRA